MCGSMLHCCDKIVPKYRTFSFQIHSTNYYQTVRLDRTITALSVCMYSLDCLLIVKGRLFVIRIGYWLIPVDQRLIYKQHRSCVKQHVTVQLDDWINGPQTQFIVSELIVDDFKCEETRNIKVCDCRYVKSLTRLHVFTPSHPEPPCLALTQSWDCALSCDVLSEWTGTAILCDPALTQPGLSTLLCSVLLYFLFFAVSTYPPNETTRR